MPAISMLRAQAARRFVVAQSPKEYVVKVSAVASKVSGYAALVSAYMPRVSVVIPALEARRLAREAAKKAQIEARRFASNLSRYTRILGRGLAWLTKAYMRSLRDELAYLAAHPIQFVVGSLLAGWSKRKSREILGDSFAARVASQYAANEMFSAVYGR